MPTPVSGKSTFILIVKSAVQTANGDTHAPLTGDLFKQQCQPTFPSYLQDLRYACLPSRTPLPPNFLHSKATAALCSMHGLSFHRLISVPDEVFAQAATAAPPEQYSQVWAINALTGLQCLAASYHCDQALEDPISALHCGSQDCMERTRTLCEPIGQLDTPGRAT